MKYENLRKHILTTSRINAGGSVHHHLWNLATKFGLQKAHVEQILLEMKGEGLIDVAFDNVFAVVTVTMRGAVLLENLPKRTIGFIQGCPG